VKATTTHTPGPWVVTEFGIEAPEQADWHGRNVVYSNAVAGYEGSAIIKDADARLIAAAPELLEALRDLLDYVCTKVENVGWSTEPEYVAGRAAIKKAVGE
jgi:hypothetical protein